MPIARHLLYRGATLPPAPPRPARPTIVKLDRRLLDRYAGTYRSDSLSIRIARREDHLLFYPDGGGISVLWPVNDSDFVSKTSEERLTITAGALSYWNGATTISASRSP